MAALVEIINAIGLLAAPAGFAKADREVFHYALARALWASSGSSSVADCTLCTLGFVECVLVRSRVAIVDLIDAACHG